MRDIPTCDAEEEPPPIEELAKIELEEHPELEVIEKEFSEAGEPDYASPGFIETIQQKLGLKKAEKAPSGGFYMSSSQQESESQDDDYHLPEGTVEEDSDSEGSAYSQQLKEAIEHEHVVQNVSQGRWSVTGCSDLIREIASLIPNKQVRDDIKKLYENNPFDYCGNAEIL